MTRGRWVTRRAWLSTSVARRTTRRDNKTLPPDALGVRSTSGGTAGCQRRAPVGRGAPGGCRLGWRRVAESRNGNGAPRPRRGCRRSQTRSARTSSSSSSEVARSLNSMCRIKSGSNSRWRSTTTKPSSKSRSSGRARATDRPQIAPDTHHSRPTTHDAQRSRRAFVAQRLPLGVRMRMIAHGH